MPAPSSHMWYVKAAGGVWGPYPEARIAGFVAERRVSATTPVSPWAAGPFQPAGANAEFKSLFELSPQPAPSAPAPLTRSAQGGAANLAQAAPLQQAIEPAPAVLADAGPARPVLVWAQLSAASAPNFLAILGAAGPGVTIRPGLWLVQARTNAATLRNLLSRRLSDADTLLVVEAPLEQVAWFNLEPARDRELRRLWSTTGAT
ncbi:hypothetical protein [Caulobacter sp. S45]|uniref:hypothetical protein n=1 Tax=Caulobacter sp. S45 TaxID=1641861 RepID=UPI001575894F|nr:hypothetical protein [Caulobacter sp. S45]